VVGITDGDTLTLLTVSGSKFAWPALTLQSGARILACGKNKRHRVGHSPKTIAVVERDTHRCGRTVADIILPEGRSMNREIVGQGMAWWYRRFAPRDADLARLEAEAKAARIGPWSQPRPVPPWEWRREWSATGAAASITSRRAAARRRWPKRTG
jgi:micrococcal nuclease